MTDESEITGPVSPKIEREAAQRAGHRARAARWDLDVAVFFFAILTIVIILLFQGVGYEIVAATAGFGLALGWLMGSRKGRQQYESLYQEELAELLRKSERKQTPEEAMAESMIEATIDEKVQEAMRQRQEKWR
ncbi:MAG: hypothetical protein V3R92_03300 [Dehalococcoidales bacterium]